MLRLGVDGWESVEEDGAVGTTWQYMPQFRVLNKVCAALDIRAGKWALHIGA